MDSILKEKAAKAIEEKTRKDHSAAENEKVTRINTVKELENVAQYETTSS